MHLHNLVAYHISDGNLSLSDMIERGKVTTLNGEVIKVIQAVDEGPLGLANSYAGEIMASVNYKEVFLSNGALHGIYNLLTPSFLFQGVIDRLLQFSSLQRMSVLVVVAGLEDVLQNQEVTLLSPSDSAFDELDPAYLSSLMRPENEKELHHLISFHILETVQPFETLVDGSYPTRNGMPLEVRIDESGTRVNQASLTQVDILASNGIMHVIDSVLFPEKTVEEINAERPSSNPISAAEMQTQRPESVIGVAIDLDIGIGSSGLSPSAMTTAALAVSVGLVLAQYLPVQ